MSQPVPDPREQRHVVEPLRLHLATDEATERDLADTLGVTSAYYAAPDRDFQQRERQRVLDQVADPDARARLRDSWVRADAAFTGRAEEAMADVIAHQLYGCSWDCIGEAGVRERVMVCARFTVRHVGVTKG